MSAIANCLFTFFGEKNPTVSPSSFMATPISEKTISRSCRMDSVRFSFSSQVSFNSKANKYYGDAVFYGFWIGFKTHQLPVFHFLGADPQPPRQSSVVCRCYHHYRRSAQVRLMPLEQNKQIEQKCRQVGIKKHGKFGTKSREKRMNECTRMLFHFHVPWGCHTRQSAF